MKPNHRTICLLLLVGITTTILLTDSSLAQGDPFSIIEDEGNKFLDFVLTKIGRIVAGIAAFVYLMKFLLTRKFDVQELLIYGACIVGLSSIDVLINYFFN